MQYLKYLCFLNFLPLSLIATESNDFEPLYAGTLLSFFPTNVAPARISVEPYVFVTSVYGTYDKNWSVLHQNKIYNETLLLALETGITDFLDISLILNENHNHHGNQHAWRYGDTVLYFGFQLMRNQKSTWRPDMRLLVGEIFPTGKYQNLDPNRTLIDISGAGSYQTSLLLVTRKIFYTSPCPISLNLNLFYIIPSSVSVHGYNSYGGGQGTKGSVSPGNSFITNIGCEISLNRNWELGLDIRYEHQNKSPFSGKTVIPTGLPSSERVSLAPCIAYNFNEDFSLASGVWFSVAGRNDDAFASWVSNIFYLF